MRLRGTRSHGVIALRVQPVPSLLFYNLPRLVKRDPAAWMVGDVRYRRLVVVVLVDAEWWFSCSHPGILHVGICFLCEWKNVSCRRGFRNIGHFVQAVEVRDLSLRDSICKGDSLRMYEGVVDLASVSGNHESSLSLHEA